MDERQFEKWMTDHQVELAESPSVTTSPMPGVPVGTPAPEQAQPEESPQPAPEAQPVIAMTTAGLLRRMRRAEAERALDRMIIGAGAIADAAIFIGAWSTSQIKNGFIGHGFLEDLLEAVLGGDRYYTPAWYFWALVGALLAIFLAARYFLVNRRRVYGENGEYIADLMQTQ
jgi:hypothetical protein